MVSSLTANRELVVYPGSAVLWTRGRDVSTSWTYPALTVDVANLKELGYGG